LFLVVSDGSSHIDVALTITESGQQDDEHDLIPTVQDVQDLPCDPFPTHDMGTEQLHDFDTSASGLGQDKHPVADTLGSDRQLSDSQDPRIFHGRSQVTTVPLFNNSTYDQRSNPYFTSGADNINDHGSHAEPHDQYFSRAFESYDPYFPQAIDHEESLFEN